MTLTSAAPSHRLLMSRRRRARAANPVLAVGGSMISLFGVGLATMSLSMPNGGDFFMFASLGLIASGALLAKRNAAGVWTYMAVFLATLIWSLHGVGLGGSPVGYRIAGPIIMLALLALLMPALLRWSRKRTVSVLAILIVATVMFGNLASSADGPRPISILDQRTAGWSSLNH